MGAGGDQYFRIPRNGREEGDRRIGDKWGTCHDWLSSN